MLVNKQERLNHRGVSKRRDDYLCPSEQLRKLPSVISWVRFHVFDVGPISLVCVGFQRVPAEDEIVHPNIPIDALSHRHVV